MARSGPIIVIEDDQDDVDMLSEVFGSIGVSNEIIYFNECQSALDFLSNNLAVKPFLIFSDINLPGMTGAEMKKKINESDDLRRRSIPFVFLTTSSAQKAVMEAFENLAQGFFTKPRNMNSLKHMIEMILNYWKLCEHPNPQVI